MQDGMPNHGDTWVIQGTARQVGVHGQCDQFLGSFATFVLPSAPEGTEFQTPVQLQPTM